MNKKTRKYIKIILPISIGLLLVFYSFSKISIDQILGVVTPAKLISVRRLRIETGDKKLDEKFSDKKYMKVLQGYRTTRVLPIIVD